MPQRKKKKKSDIAISNPAPKEYPFDKIIRIVCPICHTSNILDVTIPGLKSCSNCHAALHLPRPKKEDDA